MGYWSSEQKQTTKTAELSGFGKEMQDMFLQLAYENLELSGFSVEIETVDIYQDEAKAGSLKGQIDFLDNKINALSPNDSSYEKKLNDLQKQKDKLEIQLSGMPKTTQEKKVVKQKESPGVQAIINEYGVDSVQAKEAKQKEFEAAQQRDADLLDLESNWLTNLKKFANNDYSYTPEQAQQIEGFVAPIRGMINKTTDDLLLKMGQDKEALKGAIGDIVEQIDKTGFDVSSALDAAAVQYEKSGQTLFETLSKVNSSSMERAKFEFDLLSAQADQKAAVQASMLGLPPGSQAEKVSSLKMKSDALKGIQLNLAEQEARGAMEIQGGVEAGKQKISLYRADLAGSQGKKKEDLARLGFDLESSFSDKTTSILGNQADALIRLEQDKQRQLRDAGRGDLAQALELGAKGMEYFQNQKQKKAGFNQSLMQPFKDLLNTEQQRSFVESTTTQKNSPSFFDVLTDVVGAGASVAGAAMGIPSFGGGGGGGGGGGSSMASMPDFSIYTPQYNPPQSQFTLEY